jgi:hypothetical protein
MLEDAGVEIRYLGQPLVASAGQPLKLARRETKSGGVTDSATESAWDGSVHEIGTGRRFYVTAPDEITAFIATALRREPHEGEKS